MYRSIAIIFYICRLGLKFYIIIFINWNWLAVVVAQEFKRHLRLFYAVEALVYPTSGSLELIGLCTSRAHDVSMWFRL